MDLAHWIERHAGFTPTKTAIRFAGLDWTFSAFAKQVRRAVERLTALGVQAGHAVGFLGYNNPEMLAVLFACARLRAMLVPLNWRLAPPEHVRILRDCSPKVILVEESFVAHAEALRDDRSSTHWISLGVAPPHWLAWTEIDSSAISSPAALLDDDASKAPILLCYTSGSTGVPKGVVLTQSALTWNAVNSTHMHDLTSGDRVLTTLPMFHVGGLNIQTLPALHAGASVVLHAKFDPAAALQSIERDSVTLAVLVPAQLVAMMEHPRWVETDLSSLRMITTGSTIVTESFVRQVNDRGLRLVQVYGATETCPIATYVRAEEAVRKAGSAGLPALHSEVRIADVEGRDVPVGQDGEILVRGPNLMRNYWMPHEAPATHDGWYASNDIGHFDADGYLYVVSRRSDMIISGGENIYPTEIESILLECRAIREVCVLGRADERWGEVVVAVVVPHPGSNLTEADVLALFDGRIARYKRPREVRFLGMLPRTDLGKVKKSAVRTVLEAVVPA